MHRFLPQAAFVAMALLCPLASLEADPLLYSFAGTFFDGTQHTGSFVYDPASNVVSSWDMGSWGSVYTYADFNSSLNDPNGTYSSTADAGADSFNNGWDINFHYTQVDNSQGYTTGYDFYTLQVVFANALTGSEGMTPIIGGSGPKGSYFYFANDFGGGSAYPIPSGSVTELEEVPEPAFLSIAGILLLGSVWVSRTLAPQRRAISRR